MIRKALIITTAFIISTNLALAQSSQPSPQQMPLGNNSPAVGTPVKPLALPPANANKIQELKAEPQKDMKKPNDTQAATQKVNLNTAPPEQLDTLPEIGKARSKAIIEARKTKFKDWNDFEARKVVPADALKAIKERVTF